MERLEQMKRDINTDKETQNILRQAENYYLKEPISVTENKYLTFCSDNHYYSSIGPYRWKDPDNEGKYILKDGMMNPEWKYYDGWKLNEVSNRCIYLSKAYYLTKEIKYYNAFMNQLRIWFIDEDTYMYPNFEYAQVIPGKNNDKGSSMGMIEAYPLIWIIESIRLVNNVKKIDSKTLKQMKSWMEKFAVWADNKYGDYYNNVQNNISLAFDITLINLYLFSGKEIKAKLIADDFLEKRILTQIKEDGSQPAELIRKTAYAYSIFNLGHIIDFCFLVRYWDKEYYKKNCERVDKAIEYLQSYADNPDQFPYQQITSWENCIKSLNTLKHKRDFLLKN